MFDFIEILRKTFAEYYKEKRLAKRQIKHLKECLKFWNDVHIKLKSIRNLIQYHNELVPQKDVLGGTEVNEFQSFLLYGWRMPDGARVGRGYIEDIEHRHVDILINCIERTQEHYNHRRYDEVERYCKKYYDECVYFDKNYGTNTQKLAEYPKF